MSGGHEHTIRVLISSKVVSRIYDLQISSNSTLNDLHRAAAFKHVQFGCNISQRFIMTFEGKILSDAEEFITDSGIENGSIVEVIQIVAGGSDCGCCGFVSKKKYQESLSVNSALKSENETLKAQSSAATKDKPVKEQQLEQRIAQLEKEKADQQNEHSREKNALSIQVVEGKQRIETLERQAAADGAATKERIDQLEKEKADQQNEHSKEKTSLLSQVAEGKQRIDVLQKALAAEKLQDFTGREKEVAAKEKALGQREETIILGEQKLAQKEKVLIQREESIKRQEDALADIPSELVKQDAVLYEARKLIRNLDLEYLTALNGDSTSLLSQPDELDHSRDARTELQDLYDEFQIKAEYLDDLKQLVEDGKSQVQHGGDERFGGPIWEAGEIRETIREWLSEALRAGKPAEDPWLTFEKKLRPLIERIELRRIFCAVCREMELAERVEVINTRFWRMLDIDKATKWLHGASKRGGLDDRDQESFNDFCQQFQDVLRSNDVYATLMSSADVSELTQRLDLNSGLKEILVQWSARLNEKSTGSSFVSFYHVIRSETRNRDEFRDLHDPSLNLRALFDKVMDTRKELKQIAELRKNPDFMQQCRDQINIGQDSKVSACIVPSWLERTAEKVEWSVKQYSKIIKEYNSKVGFEEFSIALSEWLNQNTLPTEIDFDSFVQKIGTSPTSFGRVIAWVRKLRLDYHLARCIRANMTGTKFLAVLNPLKLAEEKRVILSHGSSSDGDHRLYDVLQFFLNEVRSKAFQVIRSEVFIHDEVEVFIHDEVALTGPTEDQLRSKFGDYEGKYGTLDQFYQGMEARIGYPNPVLYEGMKREHRGRDTRSQAFVTPNYNLITTSDLEWNWVTDPNHYEMLLVESKTYLHINSKRGGSFFYPGEVGSEYFKCKFPLNIVKQPELEADIINQQQELKDYIPRRLRMAELVVNQVMQDNNSDFWLRDVVVAFVNWDDSKGAWVVQKSPSLTFSLNAKNKELVQPFQDSFLRELGEFAEKLLKMLRDQQLSASNLLDGSELTKFKTIKSTVPSKGVDYGSWNVLTLRIPSQGISQLFIPYPEAKAQLNALLLPEIRFCLLKVFSEIIKPDSPALKKIEILEGIPQDISASDVNLKLSLTFEGSAVLGLSGDVSENIFEDQLAEANKKWKETIGFWKALDDKLDKIFFSLDKSNPEVWQTIYDAEPKLKSRTDKVTYLQGRQRQKPLNSISHVGARFAQVKSFGKWQELLELCEILGLILYTGPLYVIFNAILRGFPLGTLSHFGNNRFESTIFAIVSGIKNLSQGSKVPPNRLLYRGLSGARLPKEFWLADENGFRGGVEFGLMSTTENREIAIEYGGRKPCILEIEAGQVDIGASLKFLSQYPNEDEFLMQPLSCLEVIGTPRQEVVKYASRSKEVLIVRMRVNVNLKCFTCQELKCRRKKFNMQFSHNLREDLEFTSNERLEDVKRQLEILKRGSFVLIRGMEDEFIDNEQCTLEFRGNGWASVSGSRFSLQPAEKKKLKTYFSVSIERTVTDAEAELPMANPKNRAVVVLGFAGGIFKDKFNISSRKEEFVGLDRRSWAIGLDDGQKGHRGEWQPFVSKAELEGKKEYGLGIDIESGCIDFFVDGEKIGKHAFEDLKLQDKERLLGGCLIPVISCSGSCIIKYKIKSSHGTPAGEAPDDYTFVHDASPIPQLLKQARLDKNIPKTSDLLAQFDELWKTQDEKQPEDFNDDEFCKQMLSEVLDCKTQLLNKQDVIIKLSDAILQALAGDRDVLPEQIEAANLMLSQISSPDSAPLEDFQNKMEIAKLQREGFEWSEIFSKSFGEKIRIPISFSPSLSRLVWRIVVEHTHNNKILENVVIELDKSEAKLASLVAKLHLGGNADLRPSKFENAVVGFLEAVEFFPESLCKAFQAVELTKHDYSLKGIRRAIRAIAKNQYIQKYNDKKLDSDPLCRRAMMEGFEVKIREFSSDSPEIASIVYEPNRGIQNRPSVENLFHLKPKDGKGNPEMTLTPQTLFSKTGVNFYQSLKMAHWHFIVSRIDIACVSIDMSELEFDSEVTAKRVLERLSELQSLKELRIQFCFPDKKPWQKDLPAIFLKDVLPKLKITVIDLGGNGMGCGLGGSNPKDVAAALKQLPGLKELHLRGCQLGPESNIQDVLGGLTCLAVLDLSGNDLEDSVLIIAETLKDSFERPKPSNPQIFTTATHTPSHVNQPPSSPSSPLQPHPDRDIHPTTPSKPAEDCLNPKSKTLMRVSLANNNASKEVVEKATRLLCQAVSDQVDLRGNGVKQVEEAKAIRRECQGPDLVFVHDLDLKP